MIVGMNFLPTGRLLRMLRIRRGWRQDDVSTRSGLSPAAISRQELGNVGSLAALERHAAAFSLRLDVRILGRAGALVRLGDEEHAAIVEVIASWFRNAEFDMETEGSFSEWGERGRIDLLAFDPSTGMLVGSGAPDALRGLRSAAPDSGRAGYSSAAHAHLGIARAGVSGNVDRRPPARASCDAGSRRFCSGRSLGPILAA